MLPAPLPDHHLPYDLKLLQRGENGTEKDYNTMIFAISPKRFWDAIAPTTNRAEKARFRASSRSPKQKKPTAAQKKQGCSEEAASATCSAT